MSGKELKNILQEHDISWYKLAEMLNMHQRTVYGWYGKKGQVKKNIIERIISATKIKRSLFYQDTYTMHEPETVYAVTIHHGNHVKALIERKEITLNNFARRMKKSRQTINNWFKESNWPEGRLLEAAQKLGVPIAEINGQQEDIKPTADKDILQKLDALETALNTHNELLRKLLAKGQG